MNMTTSASCSSAPDSRRSDSIGFLSERASVCRESWEIAITGTSSSLASSLSDREISLTSCWRLSTRLLGCMSWR
jgi:hypothetical protein